MLKKTDYRLYKLWKRMHKGMSIVIIPSYKCNFDCPYCIRDVMGIESKPDLGMDKWKEFLKDLDFNLRCGGSKIKEIILSGGEPSLLPYFVELSDWILDKGWFLTIYTNLSNVRTLKIKKNRKLLVIGSYHASEIKADIFKLRWNKVEKTHRVRAIEIGSSELEGAIHKEARKEKFKTLYEATLTVDADFKMYNYNLME